jgi:murein DD-endopeptidase MepM/ murein hydrolase activator NlpD
MRMRGKTRVLALSSALALLLVGGIAQAAHADTYPSWSDVKAARHSASAKATEVAKIKGLIATSEAAAAATQQVAEQRGTEYQVLRDSVDTATTRLDAIKKDVAADAKKALVARQRAGRLAAQLSRTSGTDPELELFLNAGSSPHSASDFLSRLGRLSQLTTANGRISSMAKQAQSTAAATQAQLVKAKTALDALNAKAKTALAAAVAANAAAEAELAKQQALQATLAEQLKALQSKSSVTLAQYKAGVAARKRAAAAAAGGGGAAGAVQSSGWALPASGPITDGFGYRPDRPAGANPFHSGTDIGGGCSSPIYAAHAGTVTYAGWLGTYGNFIEIANGGSISTGYAHIRPGGTFVKVGEHVSAGENIASIGTTGASTGCHLHFEVRINEVAINSVPFMAARGVTIG